MNGTTNNHHNNHNHNCTNTPLTAAAVTTTGATRVDMDDDNDDLRIVREPYIHVTSTKGKEIRAILIDAFNHSWLKVPQKEIGVIKGIIDKLHNASLLIDDIEDNSRLRRGQPCAHLIYGIPATINSANYMYFEALKDCHSLNSQQVIDTYMNELLLLHRGQAMDIHWRDNSICPTEEQYLQMVKNKTGGLFRLSVGIMQALSKQNRQTDYTKLVNDLAVLFQILDDYLNLQSDIYQENKSFCEDLTEGKFSFPIIHGINHDTHRQLLNIVRQRSNDDNLKKYALQLMEKSQSFDYTIQVLKQYESEVRHEIEKLGGNDDLLKIVDYLMSQTTKVKKQEL